MEAGGVVIYILFCPPFTSSARNESPKFTLSIQSVRQNVFPQSPKTDLSVYKNVPSPCLYNIRRFPSQITAFCRSFLYVFTHLLLTFFSSAVWWLKAGWCANHIHVFISPCISNPSTMGLKSGWWKV